MKHLLTLTINLFLFSFASADMITCNYKEKDWVFALKLDANGNGVFKSKDLKNNKTYNCKLKAKSINDYTGSPAPHYKMYLTPTGCDSRHPNFLKDMGLFLELEQTTNRIRVQWLETMQYKYCSSHKVSLFDIRNSVPRYDKNQWPLK